MSRWQQEGVGDGFHTSVLAREVCEGLLPALTASGPQSPPSGVLLDATCGAAGHVLALVAAGAPLRQLIAFDRDAEALAHASDRLRHVEFAVRMFHAPFSALADRLAEAGVSAVNAIIADLGVSSHQLDTGARGFSFRSDAPLDMRMDASRGAPLSERLVGLDVPSLARILWRYGEEPDAQRIATAILREGPTRTLALADVVSAAMSARKRRALGRRIHPATRTFQALRIWVNGELEELERFLEVAPGYLCVGGRLAVISFHSLEDRRVKQRFRSLSRAPELPRQIPLRESERPVARFAVPSGWASGRAASTEERGLNPRARSARLRLLERRCP
ncbi:MAG: 16S rRNA (cytosine(1402)-N(4))-methyltransferase RsmH [Nannocystaceae bacterium]